MVGFEDLGAPFGARVTGVSPDQVDDPDVAAVLARALDEHSVLVLPAMTLDAVQLVALANMFGALVAPEIPHELEMRDRHHGDVVELSNVRRDGQLLHADDTQAVVLRGFERWHTDGSYRRVPPTCTVLQALEVPRRGGQTQFAEMRAALRVLPPESRTAMAELTLVHSYEHWRASHPGRLALTSEGEGVGFEPVEHPWIRTLDDGSQALYMGAFVSHVAGMPEAEGRQWLAEIEAQLSVHDVVYEHQWQPHDVVVLDSRTTLYRSLRYDIANERRILRRVSVTRSEPVR